MSKHIKTINDLERIHLKLEYYGREIIRMTDRIYEEVDLVDSIFSKKFKVRGIHAEVDSYSLEDNIIMLKPSHPDVGVDSLILSFKEFAEKAEFLEEETQ